MRGKNLQLFQHSKFCFMCINFVKWHFDKSRFGLDCSIHVFHVKVCYPAEKKYMALAFKYAQVIFIIIVIIRT